MNQPTEHERIREIGSLYGGASREDGTSAEKESKSTYLHRGR